MNSLAPAELAKLRRFLLAHRNRFALALVRISQLDVREELQRWVQAISDEQKFPFRVIQGNGLTSNQLWLRLSEGSVEGSVLILTGIDEALQAVDADLAKLLNRQRERIAQLAPGPMLLVVGDMALDRFLLDAPDLADWYAAGFEFHRKTSGGELGRDLFDGPRISTLPRELIESQIKLLEGQLLDKRTDAVQAKIWLELARLYSEWVSAVPGEAPAARSVQESLEASAEAARQAAELFSAGLKLGVADRGQLGQALVWRANALAALGNREASLVITQDAVSTYRELAGEDEAAFLPNLAMSLNNVAGRLSDLGRREEALAAAEESVRLYRQVAQQRPDAFLPDLAGSLNNLANGLSNLGRREEALAAAEEAVRLRRQLAQQRPDAFLPDLAMSLINVANRLSNLGRREEALAAAEDAVRLGRQLAQQRPNAFLPNLAGSLNNVATFLSNLGRREEALAAAQEAVRLRRQLTQQRPEAFLPDLATSLGALGSIFQVDAPGDAATRFHEGIQLLSPLFLQLPQAHGRLMMGLLQDYVQAAQQAGVEVDTALLGPVEEKLQAIGMMGHTTE